MSKRRLYYLHWRARRAGAMLNTKRREFRLPYGESVDNNRWMKELVKEWKYNVQLEIV